MKFVPGFGATNAKLFVLGEAPGYHEETAEKPFVGPSGEIVRSMLSKAGISPESCFFDNVVPYRPPGNSIKRIKELGITVEQFYPKLLQTINAIKPNCILALGNTALKALIGKNGIQNYRGSILWSSGFGVKCVPSIHPAFLLHSEGNEGEGAFKYSTRAYMQLDFIRAVQESKTKDYLPPQRIITPIKDSYALYKFLEEYKDHKRFALDIETSRSVPICLGIAPNTSRAVSVQLFNIPEVNYTIPYHDLAEIHRLLIEFLEDETKEFIGQNWKFDQQKLESVLGIHVKPYADTMLLAATINPEFPKSLGFLGSVYSREPYYKDEGREFILGKDPIDQLFIYNGKDAIVTYEIFEAMLVDLREYGLIDFFFDYVMKLHEFYMELESNGFKFDEEQWKELLEKYQTKKKENQKRLEEIAGFNLNANSPKQVFQFISKDLNLPLKVGTGEDQLVALLGNHAKDDKSREAINLILDIRRVRKTIGTYLSANPDFDGRMRTSYRIVGTETGRTSTSNLDPPLRPFKGFGLAFQTITKHGDIGADIRRMLIADEGYVILDPDLSQAEARVVSLLSDDEETLALFDTTDIHKLTASWLFGKSMEAITKEERFIGKTVRHAGNYGMGKRRLMMSVNSDAKRFGINVKLSEKDAGKILEIFHKKSSKIRSIFHTSIEGLLKNNKMTIINPFGRRRMFFERFGDKLFKEAYAFIPQSTVRDHLMKSTLWVQKRLPELKFIVEAHDAMTCLVQEDIVNDAAQIFKEEFEKPIDFSKCSIPRGSLVIPCEIKVGSNYKDLKDYKIV